MKMIQNHLLEFFFQKCLENPEYYPPWNWQFAPENRWLEDEFPVGMAYFRGLCEFQGVSFLFVREIKHLHQMTTLNDLPKIHLSNEKKPGCLGYLRDEILPSYVGTIS